MKTTEKLKIECLLLFAALFLSFSAMGQKAKGSGASPSGSTSSTGAAPAASGAKAAATTSGTGSYMNGFAYKIPYGYVLEYRSEHDTVLQTWTRTTDLPKNGCYESHQTVTTTIMTSREHKDPNANNSKVIDLLNNRPISFKPNGIVPQKTYSSLWIGPMTWVKDSITCMTYTPSCCTISNNPVVLTGTNKVRTVDSLDRYYNVERSSRCFGWLFATKRLRVSVTQADSGKLMIQFKTVVDNKADPLYKENKIIRYLPTNELSAAIPISKNDSAANFYLIVTPRRKVSSPVTYLSLPYSVTQYGAVTIPFKYHFANNRKIGGYSDPTQGKHFADSTLTAPSDLTTSINIAAFIGRKWGNTRFYADQSQTHNTVGFMLAAFAGPTAISLNANNVDNNTDLNKFSSQQIALSTGAAFTFEWRTFNMGLFYGYDIPLQQSPWLYRDKRWIGFGIGFSLGMFTNNNSATQQNGTY